MAVMTTKLKAVLGDEALNELVLLLEEKSLDGRREILTRLDILDHDFTALKGELADFKTESREHRREVNERFDRIDDRFDRMHEQFNERFDRINERFDRINERFDRMHEHLGAMVKWTVGTLALFGTLITILLAIGQLAK